MNDPTIKRIHLVRHAQAEHNVMSDWEIPDPILTKVGRRQAGELHARSASIQASAELLVTSPMRRAIETTLIGFPDLKTRLDAQGKPVVLLDIAQEVLDMPCDTPLYPVEDLENSQDGMYVKAGINFRTLSPDYASKEGVFDPHRAEERARLVRRWLRERPEREIVLVAHGDILRFIVDCCHSSRRWHNCEVLQFTFASPDNEEALLVPWPNSAL